MTKKKARPKPPYRLWIRPEAHAARHQLPGYIRQRIKKVVENLAVNPRPSESKQLDLSILARATVSSEWEVRRIRLEDWRIIYALNETWQEVTILAIRRRPPYDYKDLEALLSKL